MFPNLGEFNLVRKILENRAEFVEQSPHFKGWLDVGDDCAIFDGWLVTKDLSVENTHFRLDWSTPEQAVEKHIVSNVSDISSMGGIPRLALFGLCVNRNWSAEIRDRVVKAVSDGFAKRGITLIGGDTVAGDVGMFSTTLLGESLSPTPLLRSAAQPGDDIFVTGTLGKSAAGLWILMNHPEDAKRFPELVEYHLCPKIQEDLGRQLALANVRGACMDISDGLSSELNHLSISSQKRFEIDENLLPIDEKVLEMANFYGIDALDLAMNGGEEYEILFTNSGKNDIFQKRIGSVSSGSGVYMVRKNGEKISVNAQAWSHL